MALVLLKFVFWNELPELSKEKDLLEIIEDHNPCIMGAMSQTFIAAGVDEELRFSIPSSLQVLNVPFIRALKHNTGHCLYHSVPTELKRCIT